MIPLITAGTAILDKVLGRKEDEKGKKLSAFLKNRFNPDHTDVSRDAEHVFSADKAKTGPNDGYTSGATPAAEGESAVRWKEFRWSAPQTLSECHWESVTWRFYENGLVLFFAEMSNQGARFDLGDTQGHRIELRANDGCFLGAWKTGFFVRKNNAVRHFSSHFEDPHPLLKLHYDEISEAQMGIWFHDGGSEQKKAK